MAHAGMDVAHARQCHGQVVLLVFKQRLTGAAPVRQVGRQLQRGQFAQVWHQQHRVPGKPAAMDFMHDWHAVRGADISRQRDQRQVLLARVKIFSRMRIDEQGICRAGIAQVAR